MYRCKHRYRARRCRCWSCRLRKEWREGLGWYRSDEWDCCCRLWAWCLCRTRRCPCCILGAPSVLERSPPSFKPILLQRERENWNGECCGFGRFPLLSLSVWCFTFPRGKVRERERESGCSVESTGDRAEDQKRNQWKRSGYAVRDLAGPWIRTESELLCPTHCTLFWSKTFTLSRP